MSRYVSWNTYCITKIAEDRTLNEDVEKCVLIQIENGSATSRTRQKSEESAQHELFELLAAPYTSGTTTNSFLYKSIHVETLAEVILLFFIQL